MNLMVVYLSGACRWFGHELLQRDEVGLARAEQGEGRAEFDLLWDADVRQSPSANRFADRLQRQR